MRFDAAHRPWPLPRSPWIMAQSWHDLLFAHWPIAVKALRALVPPWLEIDTFDGDAWIGVVPFRMSGVRLRGVPAMPRLSAFPECNVRTYVRFDGAPGVWFFSLDADSAPAVYAARATFHLPYFKARMHCVRSGDAVSYATRRTHRGAPPAALEARYEPAGPVTRAERGSLEHFLTERYCLFTGSGVRRWRADIHHEPWPLQPASWTPTRCDMTGQIGLRLPDRAPLLHFANRLDVRIWRPRRIR